MTHSEILATSYEAYVGANEEEKRGAFKALLKLLKSSNSAEHAEPALEVLRRCVRPGLDYTDVQSLANLYRKLLESRPAPAGKPVKVALLGTFTTGQLKTFIELALFAAGIDAVFYEADYGTLRQEIIDPSSGLYSFAPQFVFLATTYRDLAHRPALTASVAERDEAVQRELQELAGLWQTAHDRLGCQIIQNNFEEPPWRGLGNHELRYPGSFAGYVARVNLALVDSAPPFTTIHDLAHLAASVGGRTWGDERFFHVAKLPCPPENLFDYGHSVASLIAAHLGGAKKCLVLDLDNTMWGGVIGDDGLAGIRLGQGDAEGEAYTAFQRYVLALKQRGVILAVCSKNEEANAREPFEKHPDMLLSLSDISCFVANWEDKASNIRRIAKELNIGTNSLVFVDDNPAERAIVRRYLPEVAVPELPVDPSEYVRAVDAQRYFQVVSLGAEDLGRTDMYKANAERARAAGGTADMAEFLKSLTMKSDVGPIVDATLERSVQLINKSNQFNLTTRRYSTAEIAARRSDPSWIDLTVTLQDRFGDNGLISVLLARVEGTDLVVDTWLMSCRVLKRGVENMVLNHLVELARRRGLRRILGEYRPTKKNDLVKDHYENLGFTRLSTDDEGNSLWGLELNDALKPQVHFIDVLLAGGAARFDALEVL